MALTFTGLKTAVQNYLDDASTTTGAQIEIYLNWALRDVARDHNWPELLVRDFVQLTAPYSTGTVDVTDGSAVVSGTSTVFAAAMVGRRFALGYSSPWYEISTQDSPTQITLADDYEGTTQTGQTYTIYDPVVAMPANCGQILSIKLHGATNRPVVLEQVSRSRVGAYGHLPGGSDSPWRYATIERSSSGAIQIEVGPYAPNNDYRLEVSYKKVVNADEVNLDEEREQLIIARTLFHAYQRDRHDLVERQDRIYRRELSREIGRTRETVRSANIGEAYAPTGRLDPRLTDYNPDSLGNV